MEKIAGMHCMTTCSDRAEGFHCIARAARATAALCLLCLALPAPAALGASTARTALPTNTGLNGYPGNIPFHAAKGGLLSLIFRPAANADGFWGAIAAKMFASSRFFAMP